MNRDYAIAKAKNLRKGKTVAVRSVDEQGKEHWTHTTHESINLAKKYMRSVGIGVALQRGEFLPQPS